jgi:predicted Zn-dependent protease
MIMLDKIVQALKARSELTGWSVRHLITREAQVYLVGQKMEAQRTVADERYRIEVFRQTTGPDGTPGMGVGEISLLPDGDVQASIDKASLVAGLVCNPMHSLPAPAALPDVPLLDEALKKDSLGTLKQATDDMLAAASRHNDVRLTSAEGFAELNTIHHVNSRGVDAEQEMTSVNLEFVLQSKQGDKEVETFREFGRRRAADLNIEAEVERNARFTLDLMQAGPPPNWQGPVVLRDNALVTFVAGDHLTAGVLQSKGSASQKYAKVSAWEIGQSVFRGEVTGDSLTVWANRYIPFGIASNRFDEEGLPAQRVELIRDNKLVSFVASQRYADYLGLSPTGAFGGVELPAGKWETASLLAETHVEIALFSWFNPDNITGDFATEIRLGYLVENGVRKPFKGGQLIGNYMDALANVRWSRETGTFGHYLGPQTARFGNMKIAGD